MHIPPTTIEGKLGRKGYDFFPNQGDSYNGTAVIMKKDLATTVENIIIKTGRIQLVKATIQQKKINIITSYLKSGNTSQSTHQRTQEINTLQDAIRNQTATDEATILGGDFNLIESPIDTANPQNFYSSEDVRKFVSFKNSCNLDDTFRTKDPTRRQYTRIQGDSASRIDRIYIYQTI